MTKKLIGIFLFLLSFSAQSQLDVKLNLLALSNSKPELALDMGYDKFSIEFINGFILKKWGEAEIIDGAGNSTEIGYKRFGYNGIIKANYYFKPPGSIDGWHVSPFLQYRHQRVDFENPAKENRFAGGLMLGRKDVIWNQFGYQVEAGFGYWFHSRAKIISTGEPYDFSEEVPFFAELAQRLRKYNVPLRISVFYRLED